MNITKKKKTLQRRKWRIRKKVNGCASRPRLSLFISNQHMFAQCIDDSKGATLYSLSTLATDSKLDFKNPNVEMAGIFGQAFGEGAKKSGIESIVFDRRGRLYHGTVKAFVDAVRKSIIC